MYIELIETRKRSSLNASGRYEFQIENITNGDIWEFSSNYFYRNLDWRGNWQIRFYFDYNDAFRLIEAFMQDPKTLAFIAEKLSERVKQLTAAK